MNQHPLKYYWGIYKKFWEVSAAEAMSFRLNFVLYTVLELGFYAATFGPVHILLTNLGHIGPWNYAQWMFFTAFVIFVDWLQMLLIGQNFWMFSHYLRTGMADYHILRPASPIFSLFFRQVRIGAFLNGFMALYLIVHFGIKAGLARWAWAFLPLGLILAITTRAILEMLIACAMFWVMEGMGVNFMRIQMQNIARYPDFTYGGRLRNALLWFFPVLLFGSGPVRFMLDPHQWGYLAAQVGLTFFFGWLLKVTFNAGLRRYESASS